VVRIRICSPKSGQQPKRQEVCKLNPEDHPDNGLVPFGWTAIIYVALLQIQWLICRIFILHGFTTAKAFRDAVGSKIAQVVRQWRKEVPCTALVTTEEGA
jgi:hypothetical protein